MARLKQKSLCAYTKYKYFTDSPTLQSVCKNQALKALEVTRWTSKAHLDQNNRTRVGVQHVTTFHLSSYTYFHKYQPTGNGYTLN